MLSRGVEFDIWLLKLQRGLSFLHGNQTGTGYTSSDLTIIVVSTTILAIA